MVADWLERYVRKARHLLPNSLIGLRLVNARRKSATIHELMHKFLYFLNVINHVSVDFPHIVFEFLRELHAHRVALRAFNVLVVDTKDIGNILENVRTTIKAIEVDTPTQFLLHFPRTPVGRKILEANPRHQFQYVFG